MDLDYEVAAIADGALEEADEIVDLKHRISGFS